MKFGKRLQDEMVEAWKKYYVSYKRLKNLVELQPNLKGSAFTSELFRVLREELERAEAHFAQLIEELTVTYEELVALPTTDFRNSVPVSNNSLTRTSWSIFPRK